MLKKMKKKNNTKKELRKIEKEFVSFGNKKKVFWKITIATIIISIIGIPVMINNQDFLKRFLVIWILEIIYIAMWMKWGERKRR
jgi:undecaprenyl pyrophosphate phosphatase UppP